MLWHDLKRAAEGSFWQHSVYLLGALNKDMKNCDWNQEINKQHHFVVTVHDGATTQQILHYYCQKRTSVFLLHNFIK